MHMALKPTGVNGNGAPHVSGRGLRRRKLSRDQRVYLAAGCATGELQFWPSLGQACAIFGVTTTQVREELKVRAADHENDPTMNLITAWNSASEDQREAAIRAIGVAEVWDVLSRAVA